MLAQQERHDRRDEEGDAAGRLVVEEVGEGARGAAGGRGGPLTG
jgi:hypothetical protein